MYLKILAQPPPKKNLGRSPSLSPAALRGSPKEPTWFLLPSGAQTGFVLTNLTQLALPSLSLAPEHFWYFASTHSAQQLACLFRFGPFHGYCLLLERHQVFTHALPFHALNLRPVSCRTHKVGLGSLQTFRICHSEEWGEGYFLVPVVTDRVRMYKTVPGILSFLDEI